MKQEPSLGHVPATHGHMKKGCDDYAGHSFSRYGIAKKANVAPKAGRQRWQRLLQDEPGSTGKLALLLADASPILARLALPNRRVSRDRTHDLEFV